MASATIMTSSISSAASRRLHYQSQHSNTSNPVNQSFPNNPNDTLSRNSSFVSATLNGNPLITIIYSNTSLSQALSRTADLKRQTISGTCTFIRLVHGENQQKVLNSYASCRRLLDHMKQLVGINQDEMIDLMDNEGKMKDLNAHFDDYATQYLTARSTYYVFKVDIDTVSGEKRYTANFNMDLIDSRINSQLQNSLNVLNRAVGKPKRPTGTTRQNTTVQSASSNAPQTKSRRSNSRKQT